MLKHEITEKYLHTTCRQNKREIDEIIDSVYHMIDTLEKLAPSEVVQLMEEQIWYMLCIFRNIRTMIDDLCCFGLTEAECMDMEDLQIVKEKELLFFLRDLNWNDRVLGPIMNCGKMIDYWCKQKWVDGESGPFDSSLCDKCQRLISSLEGEVVPTLAEDIDPKAQPNRKKIHGMRICFP